MKKCKRCGKEKPLSEYHKSRQKLASGEVKEYPKPFCKPCGLIVRREDYKVREKPIADEYRHNRDKFKVGVFICF